MFDYQKFEDDVVRQIEAIFHKWTREHDDLYIFALDCAMGMESIGVIANTAHYLAEQAEPNASDYFYYKYCEEEWELPHWFQDISEEMNRYLLENEDVFSGPVTFEYTEAFDEHSEKMVECCENALVRFKRSLGRECPDILLTLYIRDYFDGDGRVEIFEKLNGRRAAEEYAEHIEEFV